MELLCGRKTSLFVSLKKKLRLVIYRSFYLRVREGVVRVGVSESNEDFPLST